MYNIYYISYIFLFNTYIIQTYNESYIEIQTHVRSHSHTRINHKFTGENWVEVTDFSQKCFCRWGPNHSVHSFWRDGDIQKDMWHGDKNAGSQCMCNPPTRQRGHMWTWIYVQQEDLGGCMPEGSMSVIPWCSALTLQYGDVGQRTSDTPHIP